MTQKHMDLYRENAIAIASEARDSLHHSRRRSKRTGEHLRVRNVLFIVTYTLPLKTNTHYRRLTIYTRSGSCDRSDPDVAIKAYNMMVLNPESDVHPDINIDSEMYTPPSVMRMGGERRRERGREGTHIEEKESERGLNIEKESWYILVGSRCQVHRTRINMKVNPKNEGKYISVAVLHLEYKISKL